MELLLLVSSDEGSTVGAVVVRITTRRRAVRYANTGPTDKQTQQGGTNVRFGGRLVLQPGHDGCPTRWTYHGRRIRTNIWARDDDGGWLWK